jgi:hypothetical protein
MLCFGLIFACIILYMSSRAFARSPETTARLMTVVIMVTAALVLITAGYSNDQVAAVFGLFGTIVGYILGRRDQPVLNSDEFGAHRSTRNDVPKERHATEQIKK